jgi:hypothetical protein
MQFNPVYLYVNKLDVFTTPTDTWSTERYRRVYNRNLKIFRGVDNRIDIQVRNSDQKSSNLTPPLDPIDQQSLDNILVFNLVSQDTKDLVLQKDFTAMDLATGKVTITLTEQELLDINSGFYNYSIIKELRKEVDSTDYKVISKMPLYMDSQYDTVGTLEITGDVYGDVEESVVVNAFNYTNPFTQGATDPAPFYTSSIIDARPKNSPAYPIHTFQFYSTNYKGTVEIQASLDDQGATPRETKWITVSTVDLATEHYKNITGKYNWFRIKHTPGSVSSIARFTIAQTMLLTYNVTIGNIGKGYNVGDIIVITGNRLGGELVTNDLTITVSTVNADGGITGFSYAGLSYNGVKTFVLDDSNISVGTVDKILYR